MIYEVTFTNQTGAVEKSRYFDTLRAAKKWAKWLGTQKFVQATHLWRGGEGAERLGV